MTVSHSDLDSYNPSSIPVISATLAPDRESRGHNMAGPLQLDVQRTCICSPRSKTPQLIQGSSHTKESKMTYRSGLNLHYSYQARCIVERDVRTMSCSLPYSRADDNRRAMSVALTQPNAMQFPQPLNPIFQFTAR